MTNWNLACLDWADRIKRGDRLVPPNLPINTAEAKRAIGVFNRLRLPDVPGQPALAEAGADWFRQIIEALHGSFDPATGHRAIKELFVLAPKKSSKTSYGAALMLTSVLVNRRPRAEFVLVAPTQPVADLAFNQVVGMIEADPKLKEFFHVQSHVKRVTYRKSGAKLEVKSFDPKVMTGVKPAGVLLDELHVVASSHDADRVVGQVRGGLISQPEGFLATITTQSERPPSGVFKAELNKARAIRDGDPRVKNVPLLPVLYEFPEGVDWRDPANWWMVTPNRGKSVEIERLIPDYEGAVAAGEEELRRWASQHLNVEIGLALRSDRWAGADFWEGAAEPSITIDELIGRSEVAVVGIDGGGLDDLLGLAVIGRERGTRRWLVWTHAWAHEIVLERRKSIASSLRDFERDGDLTIVASPGDDVADVAAVVLQVMNAGLLPATNAVGLDPVGIGAVVDALANEGIGNDRVIGVSQGFRLMGAIKTVERKLADGSLAHGGSGLMDFCVGNAKIEQRGNAILITKQASGVAKIDPLMAVFDAASLMSLNPEPAGDGPSIYEERDLLVL